MDHALNHTRLWVNPFSGTEKVEEKLFFLLRVGVLGCFVGHGIWGIIGKAGWVPFFKVFYFSDATSWTLMPVIGSIDILIGILAFVYPTRALLIWVAFWTLFTAMLRPSAGMGMSEFFERAGNFGVPLAFLWICGAVRNGPWERITAASLQLKERGNVFEIILRCSLASLLIGHGGMAFFIDHHPVLTKHFHFMGIPTEGMAMKFFGLFEMGLGVIVFLAPRAKGLLWFILFYKLATELLHPLAGRPVDFLETFERMGDYVIPLMLMVYYFATQTESVRQRVSA